MIEFQNPLLLALFPVAAAVVILASRPPRRAATTVVRLLILLALLLALAGPGAGAVLQRPPHAVYLVDVSESAAPEDIERALDAIPDGSDVLVFAGGVEPLGDRRTALHRRTEVELRRAAEEGDASGYAALHEWKERMETRRTDLAGALVAARARFRAERENHIVLVTDGRATEGLPGPARDVTLVPLPARPRDVRLLDLRAPVAVREGEPFDLLVDLDATFAGKVELSLHVDHREAAALEVEVAPGRSTVVFPNLQQKEPLAQGMRGFWVYARAPGDEELRNNQAFTAVTVTGKPRILIVNGAPLEVEFLAHTLKTQDMEVEAMPASALRRADREFDGFDAVVLAGVTAEDLPAATVARLREYLSARGGGLLFVAAPAMEEQGKSPSESALGEILPVAFEKGEKRGGDGGEPGPGPPAPDGTGGDA
ncbi:MAG: hypothetical protein ACYTAF_11205, partial [Planctomycetota bacterium]